MLQLLPTLSASPYLHSAELQGSDSEPNFELLLCVTHLLPPHTMHCICENNTTWK